MPYKDPEKARENKKKYYLENKDKIKKRSAEWNKFNKEKRKAISKRDNKKRSKAKRIWWENKEFDGKESIIGKTVCSMCGLKKDLVVHHVDCNHENNDPNNLKIICKACHAYIHGKIRGGINI